MMKSFFKKLAFVMALAMVVSMVAPAGAVFAAEVVGVSYQGTKTIVTEEHLEVGDTVDFAFEGYEGWKKGTPYKWESSNETVASVDKAGVVTGLTDGEATITITVNGTWTQSVKVVVGEGAATEAPVVNGDFVVRQVSDSVVELVFADKTITKEALSAGLNTYFLINGVKVVYPVYEVKEVKDGVAKVASYVLFEDGTVYGFTYGEETAEFKATIGEVASVDAYYKCLNDNYAAYVGENTQIVATLRNAQGIDITQSAIANKGSISYNLVTESTNGDYWPSGSEGQFYFNTAGVTAIVKVTYMTGEYDEMYNPIAGPEATLPMYSTEKPRYDIDQTQTPVATLAKNGEYDITKPSTVIALHDDSNTNIFNLVVKMKDNRGNENVYTNAAYNNEGKFTFQSTNNAVLYINEDNGQIMTNSVGDVSILVKLTTGVGTTNEATKVVAVVPVYVKAERTATSVTVNQAAAVISTVPGYNTATFKFTVKDQLGDKIDPWKNEVILNNANNLPAGVTDQPDFTNELVREEKGVYKVTITGSTANLPTSANGYTYTFTVKLNNTLTRTFNVTIRKPVNNTNNTAVAVSGYKLEFSSRTNIKTSGTTVAAFNNVATLYQLSNNVKFDDAPMEVKPASISGMKVGNFYFTISKDGKAITDINATDSLVKTNVDGQVLIDLTKFEAISGTGNTALDGSLEVKKDKLGTGTYTIVVYKGLGTGETGVATATTFTQVTSNTLNVTDSQDTMSYIGRNGENTTDTKDAATIIKNNFKFKIGDVTLDTADKYVANQIEVVVDANDIGGTVVYINHVDFYKKVGVRADGVSVFVKYRVYVNDYVNYVAQ